MLIKQLNMSMIVPLYLHPESRMTFAGLVDLERKCCFGVHLPCYNRTHFLFSGSAAQLRL